MIVSEKRKNVKYELCENEYTHPHTYGSFSQREVKRSDGRRYSSAFVLIPVCSALVSERVTHCAIHGSVGFFSAVYLYTRYRLSVDINVQFV